MQPTNEGELLIFVFSHYMKLIPYINAEKFANAVLIAKEMQQVYPEGRKYLKLEKVA